MDRVGGVSPHDRICPLSLEEEWQPDGGQIRGLRSFWGEEACQTPGELKLKNVRKSIFIELYDNSLPSENEGGRKGFILGIHR